MAELLKIHILIHKIIRPDGDITIIRNNNNNLRICLFFTICFLGEKY